MTELRRARVRAFPKLDRRTGQPSAMRDIRRLEKLFGPEIPLSPQLRRDLLRRRIDEIDGALQEAGDEATEDLQAEKAKHLETIAELEARL